MKTPLKIYLTSVLVLIFVESNFAQTPIWAWAKGAGGVSNEYSNAVCTDANGNVYITGTFQSSTITFGSFTLQNVATGSLDIFVVKYDASGNVLWAKSAGGTSADYAYGICADIGGNVYITGFFQSSSITFGTISLTGFYDVFVAKYDMAGNALWAKNAVGGSPDYSYGICTDANSNVYITGMFQSSTLTFGSYILTNFSISGYNDIFIAKYDAGGNVLWAKGMGGLQGDCGNSICIDAIGNVYITGYFQQTATFGSGTITSYGYMNIFVAKYDTYGNNLWAKRAIGPTQANYVWAGGITCNEGGNVYVTGSYTHSISFGSDTLANSGAYAIFVAKYDTNGNAIWGRTPGGTGNDYGTGVCTDANDNIFVTGYFGSSYLNFGGYPVLNTNVGYNDIYVAEYDANGNAIGATSIGEQDNDYSMGICGGIGGDVYVTGYFGSYSLNFGSTTLTNNGSFDTFLAKLSSLVGIDEAYQNKDNSSVILYPNPTTKTFAIKNLSSDAALSLQIINPFGAVVYTEMLSGREEYVVNTNLSSGIYFVRLLDGEKSIVRKLIIE